MAVPAVPAVGGETERDDPDGGLDREDDAGRDVDHVDVPSLDRADRPGGRIVGQRRHHDEYDLALNMICQYIYLWMYATPAADLHRWIPHPDDEPLEELVVHDLGRGRPDGVVDSQAAAGRAVDPPALLLEQLRLPIQQVIIVIVAVSLPCRHLDQVDQPGVLLRHFLRVRFVRPGLRNPNPMEAQGKAGFLL